MALFLLNILCLFYFGDGIYWTDLYTSRMIFALVRVDFIEFITQCYCVFRAFNFAGTTSNTFIGNYVCHCSKSFPMLICFPTEKDSIEYLFLQ